MTKQLPDDDPAIQEMQRIIAEEEASREHKSLAHKALIARIREVLAKSKGAREDAAFGPPGQDE